MKTFFNTIVELSDLNWFMVDVISLSVFLLVVGIVLIKRK